MRSSIAKLQDEGAPTKRRRGGQTTYTQAKADEIVERLSEGETLYEICRTPGMPAWRTVYHWLERNPGFQAGFARARIHGFDVIASRVRATARGLGKSEGGDSTGDVVRDRLIIDTDLKLLAKWDPKGYGDKLSIENNEPLPVVDFSGVSDEALREIANALNKQDVENPKPLGHYINTDY